MLINLSFLQALFRTNISNRCFWILLDNSQYIPCRLRNLWKFILHFILHFVENLVLIIFIILHCIQQAFQHKLYKCCTIASSIALGNNIVVILLMILVNSFFAKVQPTFAVFTAAKIQILSKSWGKNY